MTLNMNRIQNLFLCAMMCCAAISLDAASKKAPEWAPAGETIRTKWASEVTPENVLPEYPRPQMVRSEWQNLNGLWDYAILPESAEYEKADGKILVPFCPESSLSGVGKYVGGENALWYERTFTVPKTWAGRDVLLHFGAVDWKCEVWVNSKKVAEHTGGYVPFTADITSALNAKGKQTLRVRVWDNTDCGWQPRGKQVRTPRGIWYTPVTGIWQTVWMEPAPKTRVLSYEPVWKDEAGALYVKAAVAGRQEGDIVRVELLEGCEGYCTETPGTKVLDTQETQRSRVDFAVETPHLWSPDCPYLYGLRISIVRDGKILDCVEGYTALRKVGIGRDKKDESRDPRTQNSYRRLALNGENVFMYGPLDQGWWPDGLYTAPTDEALRYDIERTKAWGFNMIRKHIKVEPARWYCWCDRLGIMVWQDMPCIADHSSLEQFPYRGQNLIDLQRNNWPNDTFIGGTDCKVPQEWKDNYYKEWGEIISTLRGFQSIVVWIPFNEGWGQFDTEKVVAFTRKQDPTRLVNAASGGCYCFCGDIIDVHHYACPAMNAFESRMVNVLGEYGGLGWPVEGHLWQKDKNWGYGHTYSSADEVIGMYETFAGMLKNFVRIGCSAAVYTQTTDVEVEVNGLMTYDRIEKLDVERLARINRSVIETLK